MKTFVKHSRRVSFISFLSIPSQTEASSVFKYFFAASGWHSHEFIGSLWETIQKGSIDVMESCHNIEQKMVWNNKYWTECRSSVRSKLLSFCLWIQLECTSKVNIFRMYGKKESGSYTSEMNFRNFYLFFNHQENPGKQEKS